MAMNPDAYGYLTGGLTGTISTGALTANTLTDSYYQYQKQMVQMGQQALCMPVDNVKPQKVVKETLQPSLLLLLEDET